MIEWLWNNREWVFSGIGVAVIIGIVSIAEKLLRKRSSQSDHTPAAPVQVAVDPSPTSITTGQPQTSPVSPEDIKKELESVPLLQRPDLEKHYCGIRVQWAGTLLSAEKTEEGKVNLSLTCPSLREPTLIVIFLVDPANYPGLGLLRMGAPVRVAGAIESVEGQFRRVRLKDVHLFAYGE